jgi:beta-lactam-binding protein with PASTA domain
MNLGHSPKFPAWARHIALMGLTGLFFLFVLDKSIDAFTRHGQAVVMPRLAGVDATLALQQLEALGLVGIIHDTLYVEGAIPGSVCLQDPAENSEVKEGRTVYLSIVSGEVPMVRLPNLVDVSLRKATMDLKRLGLQVGDISTRPDIAHNVVLDVRLQGRSMAMGTLVAKGTKLDLEVGMSVPDSLIPIPELVGLNVDEARMLLHENGLFLGQIIEETTISPADRAFIVRQFPESNSDELIRTLTPIDVWIAPE